MHPYFEIAEPFIKAFRTAEKEGLLYETMAEFFGNLGVTKDQVQEALHYAFMEWINK